MEIGQVLFVLFIIYRIYSWIKDNTESAATGSPKTRTAKKKKSKSMDDILGDFLKELEGKKEKKPKDILIREMHKAEDDSDKDINWQDVQKSQIKQKKQLIKHSDYSNISHRNTNIKKVITEKIEPETVQEFEEIDLRKAILYKEILERKYFSI